VVETCSSNTFYANKYCVTTEKLNYSIEKTQYGAKIPKIAIAKLKKYKSPGSEQIPAPLVQAGGEMLLPANHKLINSIWNKKQLPNQWKEYIIIQIHKNGDKTDCNNDCGISLSSTSYKISTYVLLSSLSPNME
jgi:hypothetical protein